MSAHERMPYDPDEVVRSESGRGSRFADILDRRLSRRDVVRAGALSGVLMLTGAAWTRVLGSTGPGAGSTATGPASTGSTAGSGSPTGLNFVPIAPSTDEGLVVAPNYRVQTLIRWGDPIAKGVAPFDADRQTPAHQAKAFGYNCDYVGFMPLPLGSQSSTHGLLAVNNEYVNPEMMFPLESATKLTGEQIDVLMEAVGMSVVEIKRESSGWTVVSDSRWNRRVTATTPHRVAGPAAASARMKTAVHPEGTSCTGTLSNCSAGKTPWGTVLSGEENFQGMFGQAKTLTDPIAQRSAKRYGLGQETSEYAWESHVTRFDCAKEPNEANTFGWVVEVDPYEPDSVPVKRTSLGRFRHEAATTHVTRNGRVVMYSGDDARFEYVYKFVTSRAYDPQNRAANRDLLDDGVLYAARFDEDGKGVWLPLVYGEGPLTEANGFTSQADVVIDVRIAADLLGATKMDRPEDIEVNPVNQRVYVVCTNNIERGRAERPGVDSSNPRAENRHGHIIELIEDRDDHAATTFKWDLFLVCGDPDDPSTHYAGFPKEAVSPISCPDNICFDAAGNLWIATDGMERTLRLRDGFFAVPTQGPERGKLIQFMASVVGSEVCGPEFTPDGKAAFLAIQHPGEGSTFQEPSTRWPDGVGVPKPSVIVIEANDGGLIGSAGGPVPSAK